MCIYLFVYLYAYVSVCVSLYASICVYYVSGFLNWYIVLWWQTSGKGLLINVIYLLITTRLYIKYIGGFKII